ncbi:MAG: DEAD/DEAH box helicase [Sphingomonadales bacterium]|nr:DEAD/DEAH box helicase [Sphingomonadales bacterium]
MNDEIGFDRFGLHPDVLDGLAAMGFRKPSPVQQQAIPLILDGRDLIACAQTGTGKTAAFVLPLIDHLIDLDDRHLSALILTPTRELALQIDQQIEGLSYYSPISSIPIYGGGDGALWDQQHKALRQGADLVVATPGRLWSFMATGNFQFDRLRYLILDEADRMLDMGFLEDIMRIVARLPKERQTLMFSATMPDRIRQLASSILRDPAQVSIAVSRPADKIEQMALQVMDDRKLEVLLALLAEFPFRSALIFCSSKDKVKQLHQTLRKSGVMNEAFHSDLEQQVREEIMRGFKAGRLPVLVGTDVLSRGIDVDNIDLVINYDVPPDPEDYVHRIGRTGRAERNGRSITIVNPMDLRRWKRIEELVGRALPWTERPLCGWIGSVPKSESRGSSGGKGGRKPSYKKRSK